MPKNYPFDREDVAPSWWGNAIQEFLSGAGSSLRWTLSDNGLVVTLSRGAEEAQGAGVSAIAPRMAVPVDGRWRFKDDGPLAVAVSGLGGSPANAYIWFVADDTEITNTPLPFSDSTDYGFALAVTATTAKPPGHDVAQLAAILRWTGSKAEGIRPTFGFYDDRDKVWAELPVVPFDGQEIRFQTAAMKTAKVEWHLRYDSTLSGTAKWEFLGGPSLGLMTTTSGTAVTMDGTDHNDYVAASALSAPANGIYEVVLGVDALWGDGTDSVGQCWWQAVVTNGTDDTFVSRTRYVDVAAMAGGTKLVSSQFAVRKKIPLTTATPLTAGVRSFNLTGTFFVDYFTLRPVALGGVS